MVARVVNSALRRSHERRQYRLHLFRTFCECALIVAGFAGIVSGLYAIHLVSQI
jgi:hypothetical protein